jgi:hypothetical protein
VVTDRPAARLSHVPAYAAVSDLRLKMKDALQEVDASIVFTTRILPIPPFPVGLSMASRRRASRPLARP